MYLYLKARLVDFLTFKRPINILCTQSSQTKTLQSSYYTLFELLVSEQGAEVKGSFLLMFWFSGDASIYEQHKIPRNA